MKKVIYYASPFVLFPIVFSAVTLLDGKDIVSSEILAVFSYSLFFIATALLGSLSLTNKKFDYIMTAIVPLSIFLSLFITLFFDEGCDGRPQLSLDHALNMEYYKVWLPIVAIMMVITFFASFKPIRVSKRLGRKITL